MLLVTSAHACTYLHKGRWCEGSYLWSHPSLLQYWLCLSMKRQLGCVSQTMTMCPWWCVCLCLGNKRSGLETSLMNMEQPHKNFCVSLRLSNKSMYSPSSYSSILQVLSCFLAQGPGLFCNNSKKKNSWAFDCLPKILKTDISHMVCAKNYWLGW